MTSVLAAIVQALVAAALAPLLPGMIQTVKARLQGRRGPSPLQPYRELRRLWGKSAVTPTGTTLVYGLAPPLVAATALVALLLLPSAAGASTAAGHDMLVLVGLLVLGRFAIALASWDTGSGFALMGAARDLTVAVSVEILLLLCLLLAAVPAGSTDLNAMSAAAAGWDAWSTPAHWCALGAFLLVVVAETGRQPIDNPDTHLELTMMHEGPLLEYAGRDLALLQWTVGVRHWIVLVLAAELYLPHGGSPIWRPLTTAAWILLGCLGLAAIETASAKARLLRVPGLLGFGSLIAGIGLVSAQLVQGR